MDLPARALLDENGSILSSSPGVGARNEADVGSSSIMLVPLPISIMSSDQLIVGVKLEVVLVLVLDLTLLSDEPICRHWLLGEPARPLCEIDIGLLPIRSASL